MTKKITIAIDAMGGENAPKKNIEGLNIFLNKNKTKNDFVMPNTSPTSTAPR